MGTYMLSTWIKSITGHNNLAYFQSKSNPEIDSTCRLYLQANKTLHHPMTDCEAITSLQLDQNQIPLPDMTWSIQDINKWIQHPLLHSLMAYDTQYNDREIEYIDHNYSSDASSLLVDPLMLLRRRSGWSGAYGWSNKPPPLARKMASRLF